MPIKFGKIRLEEIGKEVFDLLKASIFICPIFISEAALPVGAADGLAGLGSESTTQCQI